MDQESKKFIEGAFEKWTGVVMGEFKRVDERFDTIDTRLDGIDTRLDGIDVRLDTIDTRLDGIDTRLDGIDTRLDTIDSRLEMTDGRLDRLEEDMSETKVAVFRMEHSLQGKVEGQEDAILDLHRRMDRVENKVGLPHALSA